MAQYKTIGAGTYTKELDNTFLTKAVSNSTPACVIGTANKGPAFVPVTVTSLDELYSRFGDIDGKSFGPLAVSEWLRNASAATYIRVLGVGNGKKRNLDGSVTNAGFTVGENIPDATGQFAKNPYTRKIKRRTGGSTPTYVDWDLPGNVRFLGCYVSESVGTTWLSDAGLQRSTYLQKITPILRGIMMAPSGVILHLSSANTSLAPENYGNMNSASMPPTYPDSLIIAGSPVYGTVKLFDTRDDYQKGINKKQEFVMIMNGHRNPEQLVNDVTNLNCITASFDMDASNYFAKVFNTDPRKIQEKGHYLYAYWDLPPSHYYVTGTGVISYGIGTSTAAGRGLVTEVTAFMPAAARVGSTDQHGSINPGTSTIPDFRNWNDRFRHAKTPWIISQKFSGVEKNLFRLHALSAGSTTSTKYKFSIENITPPDNPYDYGTFDLLVRDWDDNDNNKYVIEEWRGLNLNPSSDRYIAKIIGDQNIYYDFDQDINAQTVSYDGLYPNNSNVIRVQVSDEVTGNTIDNSAMPLGVRGYQHLVTSGTAVFGSTIGNSTQDTGLIASIVNTAINIQQPPIPMRRNITRGETKRPIADSALYWGVQFEHAWDWDRPNDSYVKNNSIKSFAKYFPDFTTTKMPVVVGDNWDAPVTAENGIQSCDRFHHNKFSLEKIQVVTGSNGIADPTQWASAIYVRNGDIKTVDSTKTRAVTMSDFTQENRKYLKYTFFMQGGFDGVNVFNTDMNDMTNKAVDQEMSWDNRGRSGGPTVTAYTKALDIAQQKAITDFHLLAVPGMRHQVIANKAISVVENRMDSFYVMDVENVGSDGSVLHDGSIPSISATVNRFLSRGVDTTYAAAYFPDVLMQNPQNQTSCVVPPSVVVLGAMALNDKLGHPWFAPAGFTRGVLETTLDSRVYLSQIDIGSLYAASVNPLVRFTPNPNLGALNSKNITVWGQKTLTKLTTSLDRVNVRRLLIEIRRKVHDVSQKIIFEQNRDETLARFTSLVQPILRKVQAQSGLDRYKVTIDASTTTQQDIENNTIRGKIFVQPTKSIEYVFLDFVVSNSI